MDACRLRIADRDGRFNHNPCSFIYDMHSNGGFYTRGVRDILVGIVICGCSDYGKIDTFISFLFV